MPQQGLILKFCLECSLKINAVILFLVKVLDRFFTFFLECSPCICLSFHVWKYPQWKQVIACHWHFCYQMVAWTYVINHTVIFLHVDSVTFCISCPMLNRLCFRPLTWQTLGIIFHSPCLFRIPTIPFPKIVTWTLFPSVTSVWIDLSRLKNKLELLVIWLLHPESKYPMSFGISWTTFHLSGYSHANNIVLDKVLVLVN